MLKFKNKLHFAIYIIFLSIVAISFILLSIILMQIIDQWWSLLIILVCGYIIIALCIGSIIFGKAILYALFSRFKNKKRNNV